VLARLLAGLFRLHLHCRCLDLHPGLIEAVRFGVDLGVVQAQFLVGLALEHHVGQAGQPSFPVFGVHVRLVVFLLD
jgi:hypothetical protein